jgi:hypothetical protein
MKNFDFVNDVDGYFFIYKNSNVSQYISRCIGISILKLHNIIRKHNGKIFKDQCDFSTAICTYRFDTMEECKRAAEEFERLLIMKKLAE